MDFEQFDKIDATFKPRRTDDLIAGCERWIGHRCEWQAAWIIADGQFAGEWAMIPLGDDRWNMPFAWIPSGDLEV